MICDTALVYGFEPLFSPHASMGKDGKRLETRTASRYTARAIPRCMMAFVEGIQAHFVSMWFT